jgi:hypothetical protein
MAPIFGYGVARWQVPSSFVGDLCEESTASQALNGVAVYNSGSTALVPVVQRESLKLPRARRITEIVVNAKEPRALRIVKLAEKAMINAAFTENAEAIRTSPYDVAKIQLCRGPSLQTTVSKIRLDS